MGRPSTGFQFLYLPGFLLIVAGLATVFIQKISLSQTKKVIQRSLKTILGPAIALGFAVPMVKVFINSGVQDGLDKMPVVLANAAASLVGNGWTAFAAVIGAMGAFIAGSNTVSNLMFSLFQHGVATELAISSALVVALQAVGAAAGNMIAIHNVVAASATVGLLGQEGATLRKTILPTLYYLVVVGVLGLLAVYVLNVG